VPRRDVSVTNHGLFCLMWLFGIFNFFGLQIYRVWVRVRVRVTVKT